MLVRNVGVELQARDPSELTKFLASLGIEEPPVAIVAARIDLQMAAQLVWGSSIVLETNDIDRLHFAARVHECVVNPLSVDAKGSRAFEFRAPGGYRFKVIETVG